MNGGREGAAHWGRMTGELPNILQRRREWQEDRREDWFPGFFQYQTTFLTSLDVQTAFDVANGEKPGARGGGILGRYEDSRMVALALAAAQTFAPAAGLTQGKNKAKT